jgi:hypothetical protein
MIFNNEGSQLIHLEHIRQSSRAFVDDGVPSSQIPQFFTTFSSLRLRCTPFESLRVVLHHLPILSL